MAASGLGDEIEAARDEQPALGHAADEPCANCGARRHGPFCHRCGQADHVHRNLHALVHDLAHGVFHFDGKIRHTLPLLAWRPGELTRRYVMGERAKFVSPVALFLFSVFLMFAVVSNLAHVGGGKDSSADLHGRLAEGRARLATLTRAETAATDPRARAALAARIAEEREEVAALQRGADLSLEDESSTGGARRAKAVDQVAHSDWPWLNGVIHHAAANPDLALYKLKTYGYKYSWTLIPISLPFLWLLFAWRRDVGLYDHAIFAIYSLSFMSLAFVALVILSAAGLPTALVGLGVLVVPPVHMYRQLKGAYALGRFGAGWRTLALLGIAGVTSVLFLLFVVWMGSD